MQAGGILLYPLFEYEQVTERVYVCGWCKAALLARGP